MKQEIRAVVSALAIVAVALASTAALAADPVATSPKAKEYLALAQKYKPKNAATEKTVKAYMKMSPKDRKQVKSGKTRGFDISMPWDFAAYAVCFYSEWYGGGNTDANIIEAGDKCHSLYLD